jgi:hypothetical protein
MSRVSITELMTGDTNNAADANATLTSWDAASLDVDDQNVRDEGIERRTLKKEFQVFGDTIAIGQPSGSFFTVVAAAYAQITPGFQIGGFPYTDGEDDLVIRCSFNVYIADPNLAEVSIRLAWRNTSVGVISGIPKTERALSISPQASLIAGTSDTRAIYTVTHVFEAGTHSDLWITAQAKITGASADLSDGFLTATMYKR